MTKVELLTVRDVMQILNISRRTVYYWIKDGILKPMRLGGVYRFHPDDLRDIVEQKRPPRLLAEKRLLAVDDDELMRDSLKRVLEREGLNVTVAVSADEALKLLSKDSFDLMMTDIRMPGMNGFELIQEIRKIRAKFGKPPLHEIVFSAYDDTAVLSEIKRLEIAAFIPKPFQLGDFIATVQKLLAQESPVYS